MGQAKRRGTFEERKAQAIAEYEKNKKERVVVSNPVASRKLAMLLAMAAGLPKPMDREVFDYVPLGMKIIQGDNNE